MCESHLLDVPCHLPCSEEDGTMWMCVDSRAINKIIVKY
jgi:hypothetical protein